MANKIGTLNLPGGNSNRPTLRVPRGLNMASNGQKAEAAKIAFTSKRSENRPVHLGLVEHILEARERKAAFRDKKMEMVRQTEAARQAAEAQIRYMRQLMLAKRIAARIMRGDNVPQRDKAFLLDKSPGMYKLAMSARNMNNDNPRNHQEALSRREERAPRIMAGDFGQVRNATSQQINSSPTGNL